MAEEKHKKKHAGHGFRSTEITHHDDGSHTIHHKHAEGPEHDVTHAVANLDGAHDSMEDHLGTPNEDEGALAAGQHGIPEAQAAPAGIPMPAAGA